MTKDDTTNNTTSAQIIHLNARRETLRPRKPAPRHSKPMTHFQAPDGKVYGVNVRTEDLQCGKPPRGKRKPKQDEPPSIPAADAAIIVAASDKMALEVLRLAAAIGPSLSSLGADIWDRYEALR